MDGAASFYAATAQQAIAPAVPLSPRPLKVVSWSTGPAGRVGASIVEKLLEAGVAAPPPHGFDVILLQELSGQWAAPLTPGEVEDFLSPVFPLLLRRFNKFCASRVCVLHVLRVARFAFLDL